MAMSEVRKIGRFKGRVKQAASLIECAELFIDAAVNGWITYTSNNAQEPMQLLLDKLTPLVAKQIDDPETSKQALILSLRKLADRLEQMEEYPQLLGLEVEEVEGADMLMINAEISNPTINRAIKIGFPIAMDEEGKNG